MRNTRLAPSLVHFAVFRGRIPTNADKHGLLRMNKMLILVYYSRGIRSIELQVILYSVRLPKGYWKCEECLCDHKHRDQGCMYPILSLTTFTVT